MILSEALAELSSIHTAKGNLAQAEKDLGEAGRGGLPETQGAIALAAAELAMAKDRYAEAAHAAQESAAAFDKAHLDASSALAFVTAADALEMSNSIEGALAACREGEKRAVRTPNQFPIALAQLCTWKLLAAAPEKFRLPIAKLNNPELTLMYDYARAVRAKRAGKPEYRLLFENLGDAARKLGYITLSRRAASRGL